MFGAIALNAIAATSSLIIGPVLASYVGDQFGFEGAFRFQAGLLVLGALFLLQLQVPPHESFTINPAVMVTIQARVKEDVGHTAGDAALPIAPMGLGMAISSFVVMRKGDMADKGAVCQRAMTCGAVITFCSGLSNSFTQVVALAFLMGLAGGFFINMNHD